MKRILSILLLAFCVNVSAAVDYTWTSLAIPDETSTSGPQKQFHALPRKPLTESRCYGARG